MQVTVIFLMELTLLKVLLNEGLISSVEYNKVQILLESQNSSVPEALYA